MSAADAGMNLDLEFNNSLPDTPNPNEVLSLKMLKDVNGSVFEPMYKDQVSYLTQARLLLLKDPWLQTKMGGTGLESCSRLAKILKKRSSELHLQDRIDSLVREHNTAQFGTTAHAELNPNKALGTSTEVQKVFKGGKLLKTAMKDTNCIKLADNFN